jgi:quercetin dioxygenase-like cupin family protein
MNSALSPVATQPSPPVHGEVRAQLVDQGYAGPVRVLEEQRCRHIVDRLSDGERAPSAWHKGYAASSRAFYDIARAPAIIERVSAFLGDDVMLWGASIQTRVPGAIHPCHSDIEISTAWGKSVSVWIGLENTEADSSLWLIPYSHRFGITVQETAHRFGKRRRDIGNEDVTAWAKRHDLRSRIVKVAMGDGEALFCDGALWHGSHNLTQRTRRALLLQYATPDLAIRIPDLKRLEWPCRLLDAPRPPCIMMKGTARSDNNRIVSAPSRPIDGAARKLSSRVYPLHIPLLPDEDNPWKPYLIFNGSTATVRALSCHASALASDHCPHPPHRHDEEEILLVLSGEVDITIPDLDSAAGNGQLHLKPGQFVYYPANFAHTLRTVSDEPANYLLLRWQSGPGANPPLGFGRFNAAAPVASPTQEKGFRAQLLFEGPTAKLRKLHCHVSTLLPGAGYSPHVDAHDVAIVVLEGEVETLGERAKPCSVIFYPAGESHGMTNPGSSIARYLVFEFHGDGARAGESAEKNQAARVRKFIDRVRWTTLVTRRLQVFGNRRK